MCCALWLEVAAQVGNQQEGKDASLLPEADESPSGARTSCAVTHLLGSACSLEALSPGGTQQCSKASKPVIQRGTGVPCLPLSVEQAAPLTCCAEAVRLTRAVAALQVHLPHHN